MAKSSTGNNSKQTPLKAHKDSSHLADKALAAAGFETRRKKSAAASVLTQLSSKLGASGLRETKDSRISARVSGELVRLAKERTGIDSDTELLEIALGNLALEDRFPATFKALRGKVDRDVDLEI